MKTTIQLRCVDGTTEEVGATTFKHSPGLAIHSTKLPKGKKAWRMTHIETGLAFNTYAEDFSYKEICEFVRLVGALPLMQSDTPLTDLNPREVTELQNQVFKIKCQVKKFTPAL